MSDVTFASGRPVYEPPKQSRGGQLWDSIFILALLLGVLFVVTYLVESAASTSEAEERPLAELPITAAEKAQYQKLIDQEVIDLQGVNQQVADNAPQKGTDRYPIEFLPLVATFGVIALYLLFVYFVSYRQFGEVIAERFGPPEEAASGGAEAGR